MFNPTYQEQNIVIRQGDDAAIVFAITDDKKEPVDLTGATAQLQARVNAEDSEALFSLDETDGLEIEEDKITATLTAARTKAFTFSEARYGLRITKEGKTFTVRDGKVTIARSYVQ